MNAYGFGSFCCRRRIPYCNNPCGRNGMAGRSAPRPIMETGAGIRESVCLRTVSPGGFTFLGPSDSGGEYQLAALTLNTSLWGKRTAEIGFACNITAALAAPDISIRLCRLWDGRQIPLPLMSPYRFSVNHRAGISDSICFTVYDTEQIRCSHCSYLAMLRFLRPLEEHGSLTVQSPIMTVLTHLKGEV